METGPASRQVRSARPMDFRDTPAEAAFRDEVRTLAARAPRRASSPRSAAGGGPGRRDRLGDPPRVGAAARPRPVGRHVLARGVRRPRRRRSSSRSSSTRSTPRPAPRPGSASSARACSRPTLIAYGTEEQKQRFLPKIQSVEELWCQGYSEPNAGSDLVERADPRRARRRRVGDQRPEGVDDARAPRASGASASCAPTRTPRRTRACRTCSSRWTSPASTVRPLKQMTGTAEFNEVFFDDARTDRSTRARRGRRRLEGRDGDARLRARHRVPVAAARGSSAELDRADRRRARERRRRRARRSASGSREAYIGVADHEVQRPAHAHRASSARASLGPEASIGKLFWSTWHRNLGELAMDVLGTDAGLIDGRARATAYELNELQRIVHVQPVGDDLRRRQRDPAQHHRRAGARAPARAQIARTQNSGSREHTP